MNKPKDHIIIGIVLMISAIIYEFIFKIHITLFVAGFVIFIAGILWVISSKICDKIDKWLSKRKRGSKS